MTEAESLHDELEETPNSAYGMARAHRSPRLSREDVFQAADAVLTGGGRVTIDRVRTHLGRGSPNTIQEHLETWWSRLGSRLKDIPGREFPELPDEVAQALQRLWNTALDAAHGAIDGKTATRDAELAERENAISVRETQWVEQSQAAALRTATLEESVSLAREQLAAANQRAERLESLLQAREADIERLRSQGEASEAQTRELRSKFDAATEAYQTERSSMDERHAANEARWLREIDRGRQGAKEVAKDHERQFKELRAQITQTESQRDESKRELNQARAGLRAAVSKRAQAEKRLAEIMLKAVKGARVAQSKSSWVRTPTRSRRR